ncbi:MAG: SDR family oxidoreductase [Deinococcota bacterium]
MILLAGGTGTLGRQVVRLLTARGLSVRVLTRDPARAEPLQDAPVEVVSGDVRDPEAVARAMRGVRTVVSAVHGFTGTGPDNPRTVDDQGNLNLIRAAGRAAADHFVLISVQGAAADHPLELFRMKYQAEQDLRASGLPWTIIRPTAFMETWAKLVGEPLLRTGRTVIFGRGLNPINFVSAHDVARLVDLAVVDPALRGAVIEIGGPENLSFRQVVETFQQVTGRPGQVRQVPLPLLRMMAALMPRVNPTLGRQIRAAVVMDTADMSFFPHAGPAALPGPLTSLSEVVRRDYGGT